jgi:hypothetical protein
MASGTAMRTVSLATALLGGLLTPFASAQEPPPSLPFLDATPTTLQAPPVSSVRLGSLVVTLDSGTLPAVARAIGDGVVSHAGDASESTYWLCYSLGPPASRQRVWLLSSGELGGSEHSINGVVAKAVDRAAASPTCPELPREFVPVALDVGVWVGSGDGDARAKLGHPSLTNGPWLHFMGQRELVGDPRSAAWGPGRFYENGSVSVRLRGGRVDELWATKSAGK